MIERRTFLSFVGFTAMPALFGLPRLSFCQDADKGPAWFQSALKKMKELGMPGIILVRPTHPMEQQELGFGLWDIVDSQNPDAHEIFLTSAFICLTPELAERVGVRKADEKSNRFLLDAEGKRVVADIVTVETFARPDAFAASFAPFLHGRELQRLKERVAPLRRTLPDEARQAIELLDSEQVEVRDRAAGTLMKIGAAWHPLLALEHRTTSSEEVRARLKSILEAIYQGHATKKEDGRLPYGTRKPEFKEHGCGGWYEVSESDKEDVSSMVDCGMGRMSDAKVRILLRFLAK